MAQRQKNSPTPHIGSQQDGEEPELRADLLSERANPGLHGGGGNAAWKGEKRAQSPDKPTE